MSTAIEIERSDRTATLTLDGPPLNILDLEALDGLRRAVRQLTDDETLRLLIVRGRGEVFSAGVAVQDHTADRIEPMLESFHAALRGLYDFPAPTLAVVRGHCLGGGMELAAACDLRFAAATARFGQPEIELGCYPPWAAAQYPGLLGHGITTDLLLTGRIVDAAEAREFGFVDRLIEPEALDSEVTGFANQVTGKSRAVSRLALAAIRARRGQGFDAALAESERIYTRELTRVRDMNEGLEAFLAKRPPEWQDR
jgi:cyclohexa-1,5-dienecarbonyl-CoA hydratase